MDAAITLSRASFGLLWHDQLHSLEERNTPKATEVKYQA
jgi:hypothetical protein